jgi:hypothetical protein
MITSFYLFTDSFISPRSPYCYWGEIFFCLAYWVGLEMMKNWECAFFFLFF